MRRTFLAVVSVVSLALPAGAVQDGSEAKGKGLDQAQLVLSEKEHSKMGLFVVTQLDNGVRGKALAEAIEQERARLKAERDQDKGKETPDADDGKKTGGTKGPGESLKHGLADKDITNFGKFVNEQHAAGLRGEALADAIQKRHEELKADRSADHAEAHPTPTHHHRHRSGGRH